MTRVGRPSATSSVLPVILGGDAGAYALGLECFEAFGVRALCLANDPVQLITDSVFFDVEHIEPGASDEIRLNHLREIAQRHPDRHLLLLANSDGAVTFFARHRSLLEVDYTIPSPTLETIDLLCEKDSFAKVCEELDIATPKTVVVDCDGPDEGWVAPTIDIPFPVVAKASSGSEYEKVSFPGKKKIWFIKTPEELDSMWVSLRGAGFRDKFLVQQLIPGGDEQMRSLTFYVDSAGMVKLRSSAHVLLQDPSPTMIGNPVAMITQALPEMWDQAEKILKAGNYTGFANFDIKVDPRDGIAYFLEVNPRIGRNSYYVVAAGQNPMTVMATDLVEGRPQEAVEAVRAALYTLVPVSLITKYVTDRGLLSRVRSLVRQHRVVNPLRSPIEKNLRRKAIVLGQTYNYYRKFKAHHSEVM
ncbi:carboxylate--amine ligase [Actinomyces minihominis]|uniref:carboxylate--amine ligase n=1 Tax=Actinomyces minihominis TaxID=2002838 RepID=UPI000C086749|nr:carboxylate--amine ligase [Actinomyces minihominis]